jgi:hypothetical protein
MTSDEEQQQTPRSGSSGQEEQQQEALYGPAGKADHKVGELVTFSSRDTQDQELTGRILFVRAPAPAIKGGRIHPAAYFVFVEGEHFPRVVYPSDIIERAQEQ